MIVKYNPETELMYIHFATGVPNVQVKTRHEQIAKFVSKVNRELVVGYEVENAAENIEHVIKNLGLSRKQALAVVLCFIREKAKKTQKEFSTIINVGESTYKSIERAEHNIGFDTLDIIYNKFNSESALHSIF